MPRRLPGRAIQAGTITVTQLETTVANTVQTGGGPKITAVTVTNASYNNLDDTAVDIAGGYIKITGTGFAAGCTVLINNTPATSTTYIGPTEVRAQVPATAAGTYMLYVINADGGVAIRVNGVTFSATPSWVTASDLAGYSLGDAISIQLAATGATTFALAQGSSLPTGLTLTSGGLLSGSVTGLENDTSYSFTITATDAELQDSPRTFSITITVQLQVSRSLRFNSADSTSLSWIPSRTGNLQTFTVSCWIKRSAITGSGNPIMVAGTDTSDYFYINLTNTDTLAITTGENGTANANNVATSAVFRDVGAWYHVVINCDFSNATSTDRIRAYVNGVRQTLTGTFAAATFTGTRHNRAGITHYIGRWMNGSPYFSGYITEFYFIDGQALLPSQFADTNVTTGQYIPKKYTGTYGTNGFYLPFTDNSSVLSLGRNYQILTEDPFWNQTVLLLNGTGTNNANNNTFTDSSSNAFAITRNGNTTQGRFSPFSQTGYSNYFDGTGDYLSLPSTAVFSIATSTTPFTVEAWVYMNATTSGSLFAERYTGGANTIALQVGFDNADTWGLGRYPTFGFYNGSSWSVCRSTVQISLSSWTHLAYVFTGSTCKIYINGVDTTNSSPTPMTTWGVTGVAGDLWYLGGNGDLSQTFPGYISNFRFVKGTAVYTSNFTPPTSLLTNITNTVLLTCQSNRFVDNSSNNITITKNGDAKVAAFSPFTPTAAYSAAVNGGSAYFDGTGDYLQAANNSALGISSGNFTIEFWINFNSVSAYPVLFDFRSAQPQAAPVIYLNNDSRFNYLFNSSTATAFGPTLVVGTWYHVAWVRSGTTHSLYINGTSQATFTDSAGVESSSLIVGARQAVSVQDYFNGYISNFRFVKGTAVYTSNFTPPTAPLTAVANTSVLLNFVDGSIVDATGDNNIETVGDAKISTAQSKWGGSSMLFDGTGDWLQLPASDIYAFGSGDYTVEAWVYFTSINDTTLQIIFMSGSTGGNSFFCHVDGNQISVGTSLAFISSQPTTITTGQWYHIAFCRSGTTLRLFVNGTQAGSNATDTTSWTSSGYARVGANGIGTQTVFGYIQDLRITRAARYTGNFTPPTAQFAYNQGDINYNQWVPANFSVTAGAGNDSLLDVPTNWGVDTGLGGEVRGNYCTWNPLNTYSTLTLSDGALKIAVTEAAYRSTFGTVAFPTTGKWYLEIPLTGSRYVFWGIATLTALTSAVPGSAATGYTVNLGGTQHDKYNNGTVTANAYTTGALSNPVLKLAYDADSGKLWLGYNTTWFGTSDLLGDPTAGTNPTFTVDTTRQYVVTAGGYNDSQSFYLNAGQRAFAYAAPSGFKSLNTHNLPTPNIVKSNTAFDTVLYTGTGSARSITGYNFSPDLVWIKSRSSASWWHQLQDTVRGATKRLATNDTGVEATDATTLTAFNADGFSLGTSTSYNENASTYVAWAWDAGTTTVVNTAGTIQSSVRSNPTAGISIVAYTGTGTSGSVGHGLTVDPDTGGGMIMIKRRDTSGNWVIGHTNLTNWNFYLIMTTAGQTGDATYFSIQPDSSVFALGTNAAVNASGGTYIAYCFAAVPGFSAFGSYTGNGSADGPFVYTGFSPRFILLKSSSVAATNWQINDTARDSYNVANKRLAPSATDAEATNFNFGDILSNGFKIRQTDQTWNSNGGTYIYAAFAESPFKYARAR